MKVKELIAELQKYDGEVEVLAPYQVLNDSHVLCSSRVEYTQHFYLSFSFFIPHVCGENNIFLTKQAPDSRLSQFLPTFLTFEIKKMEEKNE